MAEEKKSYTSPVGRMIWSSLDKASKAEKSQGQPKFSVKIAFLLEDLTDADKARFKAIYDAQMSDAKKGWPKSFDEDGKLADSDIVLGLRRPNTKELTRFEWLTRKHWIISASRGEQIGPPDLVKFNNGTKVPAKASDFSNGYYVRMSLSFYQFDNQSYGITFNLGNVALCGLGEKIVSKAGTSGVDDFGDLGADELKFDNGPVADGGPDDELDL